MAAPAGRPERVNVHDFASDAIGKAIPYGIYGALGEHRVGLGGHLPRHLRVRRGDAAPLVAGLGPARYPGARRLLICADSGGSNAARARAWKVELASLAAETGLEVTVCHYPPGTCPAPPSGTRSSTGCSPRSPATGASGR